MTDPKPKEIPVMKPTVLLAEFNTPADLVHAAEKVRDAGYQNFDTHTPFPVHGMDAAMGMRDTPLGWFVFIAGLSGTGLAFLMMWWMNGVDYPHVIGGKPAFAIPSMIPIMFEVTVLLSGITAVLGLFGLCQLPRHHHPVFHSERFGAATHDKFFLSIEATDPKFDLKRTRALLETAHPAHVEIIEEAS